MMMKVPQLWTLCCASLLVALTVAEEESAIDDTSGPQAIIDWVREAGGYFNDKLQFRRDIPGDPATFFGIYTTEDISKGEQLMSIPWTTVISDWDEERGDDDFLFCASTHLLIEEMRKGDESFYAPYTKYLLSLPSGLLPSAWSDAGKDLLQEVLGYDMLPPSNAVDLLDVNWKKECSGSDDPFEQNAAMLYHSRADNEYLVPLYDMQNHRNGLYDNTHVTVLEGSKQDVYASRDIKKGEQIYLSYNMCSHCPGHWRKYYGTPEFLRDYGFVELMPQRWVFHDQNLRFDLGEMQDGNGVEIFWANKRGVTPENMAFLRAQLGRLETVVGPDLKHIEEEAKMEKNATKNVPLPHELHVIRQYYDALTNAISLALDASKDILGAAPCGEDEEKENGTCAADVVDTHTYGEINVEKEPKTPTYHPNFPMYDFNYYLKWKVIEEDSSSYQRIKWMENAEKKDMCFRLDGVIQICSTFRPHYHDISTHFPTRYMDSVKRAVFVGGGDSMMLHELLKYPTIEKIVGLELDQKVVRKSFKYYATQPHFDDDRVDWWFGDAAKSLLMLPKDYFGSFDLVIVDLSESVMSFTVNSHLNIIETLAQLLTPEGILMKNELYFEELSEIFDNTMNLYFEGVPVVQAWGLGVGSNRKDLLHPEDTMKNWGDIKTTYELFNPVPQDLTEHFELVHDYQKNDARASGKCEKMRRLASMESNTPLAGILLILEAENTTAPLEWLSLEGVLKETLLKEGLTPLSTIAHTLEDGRALGVIVMREGILVVRTWPEEKYVALDIQLWGGFNKLESAQKSLAGAVGSESVSSYRLIVSGMKGTATESEDRKTTGPRIVQARACDPEVLKDKVIDQSTVDAVLEESLDMIQDEDAVVALLCGREKEPCLSRDVLAKSKNVRGLVILWTCPGIDDAEYAADGVTRMFECEMETLKQLRETVARHEQLSGFVVDVSAPQNMVKIFDRIWRNRRNWIRLIAERFTFIAPMQQASETWRRDFLERRRMELIDYHNLFRAEVVLKTTSGGLELDVLSGADASFLPRLINVTSAIETRTGIDTEIRKIEGGVEVCDHTQRKKWYSEDDYDRQPGELQFYEQRPLGEQQFHILEVGDGENDLTEDLQRATWRALRRANFTNLKMHLVEDQGDGVVFVAISPEGSVVVVWDGLIRVDVNIFVYDTERIEAFMMRFRGSLKKVDLKVNTLAHDEMPRGTGRVVNIREDLMSYRTPPWKTEKNEAQ